MKDQILNLSDRDVRYRLFDCIRQARGEYRVTFVRHRSRRSNRQNAWYWGCIVSALRDFLREQGQAYSAEQCHEMLKWRLLREDIVDHRTGEVVGQTVPTSTKLTTTEFAEYCELCRQWLFDQFDITVPDPPEPAPIKSAPTRGSAAGRC